jgi:hypothetical protein
LQAQDDADEQFGEVPESTPDDTDDTMRATLLFVRRRQQARDRVRA